MTLESNVLKILATRNATAQEIAQEMGVEADKISGLLNRLRSAGLLLTA